MREHNEQYYRRKLAESGVPEHMHDGYVDYLVHGIRPGDFLTAVLENDLREACGRADLENQRALFQHIFFLYNYAPAIAWGRTGAILKWQQLFQEVDVEQK